MKIVVFALALMIAPFCYAGEVVVNVNKPIDPADLTEELIAQFPNSGFHGLVYDSKNNTVVLDFPNGTPPQSQIDSVIQNHEHDKKSKAKKQKRDSAITKLKGLGLTQSEVDALFP